MGSDEEYRVQYWKKTISRLKAQLTAQLFFGRPKPRELIAWGLLICVAMTHLKNKKTAQQSGHEFCYPTHLQTASSSSWHGGNPASWETDEIPTGSCWCGDSDNYCMCTPNLSTDIILRDFDDPRKIYLVKRKDTGQHATIGGFVNVGETVEDAMIRELYEETGIRLDYHSMASHFHLLGAYSDPRRDKRRSNVSIAYIAIVPKGSVIRAGDDAKSVELVSIEDVSSLDMFADHKYILGDYATSYGLIDDPNELAAASSSRSSAFREKSSERPFHRTACRVTANLSLPVPCG